MSPIPEGRGMFVLSTKRTAGRRREVGIAFTAFVLMVAAVTGLLATPTVSAAQGGPDLCGYMWTDSSDPPPKVPFSWIEIQGNGTLISTSDWSNGGDDGYFGVSLGFNLTYYDGAYPVPHIGTNADGGVGLTYPTGPSNNLAIEFTPPVISSGPVGVGLTPCEQRSSAIPGSTADARLNVTNTGSGDDTIDMTFNSPSGWTGTFYQADGVTLLNDTDLNGYPDTGVLPAGGYIDVILRVDVAPGASGTETVSLAATPP